MTKVLGIDPSLTAAGFAVVDVTPGGPPIWQHLEVLKNKLKGHPRIEFIQQNVQATLRMLGEGDLVVMEGPSYGSVGRSHELAGVWWMIRHEIWLAQARSGQKHVGIVAPRSRAKYATGNGNADKKMVLAETRLRYPTLSITDDNMADAITLAAMGARYLNNPCDNPPPTALEALAKVAWTDGV